MLPGGPWSLISLSRSIGADHRCFAAHTCFYFDLNWVLRGCFWPRFHCNAQGNGCSDPQQKLMLWIRRDCMVKFIEKNSNKVSICAFDSTAVTFKELQKWKCVWGMYMDGYDGCVNVWAHSLPALIRCCSCTSCVEKIVMGNSFSHIFGENYNTTIHSRSRKAKRNWWLGDW